MLYYCLIVEILIPNSDSNLSEYAIEDAKKNVIKLRFFDVTVKA